MSVFLLIVGICTGVSVFIAIALLLTYAWDYSYIDLCIEFETPEAKKYRRLKSIIKISCSLAIVFSLLCLCIFIFM